MRKINKVVDARIAEKTTAELYYYISISVYTGFYESTYLSFYGTRAEELSKELNIFIRNKNDEAKKEWEEKQQAKIKELKDKLEITVDGWFNKPSKQVKKELEEEINKKWNGISGMWECWLYVEFLSKYKAVKISKGEYTTIYEILP